MVFWGWGSITLRGVLILLTDPRPKRRFCDDEDGAVAVIVALLLTVLMGFVALGVDVASLYRERAALQTDADLAAMSSVADPAQSQARAADTVERNGRPAATLSEVQTGRFLRNPELPRAARFVPLEAGTPGINAVAVRMEDRAPLHFARIFADQDDVLLSRQALAIRTGAARFSLGSHIARLDADALSRTLSGRLGATVTLTGAEVSVLASSPVNLGALLTALAAQTDLNRRNPAAILNATVSGGDLVAALQGMLPASSAALLHNLQGAAGNMQMSMATFVAGMDADLGFTASDILARVDISALDVVQALAGIRTADQTLEITAKTGVAGVLAAQARLVVSEPDARSGWITLGEEGVQLHRAASRVATQIDLVPGLLDNLLPGVTVTKIRLPVYAEVAGATATLEELACGVSDQTVAARFSAAPTALHPANGTSVAALYLGQFSQALLERGRMAPQALDYADLVTVTLRIPVPLLPDITLADVTIQAKSRVTLGESRRHQIAFTGADIRAGRTTQFFGSEALLTSGVAALLSSDRLELRVKPDQQGLVTGLVGSLLQNLLQVLPGRLVAGLTAPVDAVLDDVLGQAGLRLGEGELTLQGHHCEMVQLVQ